MATSQAKAAIAKLRKAGLPRDWFSVRTERRYSGRHPDTGKIMYEYGDAKITIYATYEKLQPFILKMVNVGLHVEEWDFGSIKSLRVTDEYGKAGLWHMDYTDVNKYNLPKTKRII